MATQAVVTETGGLEDSGRAAAWRRRSTFFLEFTAVFALVALVLILVAGLALTRYLASDIRATTLGDLESEVVEEASPRIARNLSPEMLEAPLAGEELAAFDALVRQEIISSRTLRLNVYNSDGDIVYSSADAASGEALVERDGPQTALDGEVASRIDSPSALAEPGLESYRELVQISVPLVFSDDPSQVVGAAEVYRDYTPIANHIEGIQDSVFISIAAALAALYLVLVILVRRGSNTISRHERDLQSRTDELKASYDSIVAVLCAALDLRDNVTHGHAKRVAEISSVVAWQMGLRKEQLRQIEKAAILHDIGKIGVADAVLSKPGPLDNSEWEEMKRHPELGYQIISGIDFLRDAAEVVYAHHERYDGSGYPRGLKGDEIPLGARVFAVVDAYEAMTSHRPYRKALPHRKAIEEIVRNTDAQFDPEVVRAFLEAEKRGLLNGERRDDGAGDSSSGDPLERTLSPTAGD